VKRQAALLVLILSTVSCTVKKEMPSICTPTMPSDLNDGFISSVLVSAGLPEGATVSSQMYPEKHTVIEYRGKVHAVKVRREGDGACFDFTPPIPVD
jgi:hypothetical protein